MKNNFESYNGPSSEIIEIGIELNEQLENFRRLQIDPNNFRGVKFFTDEEISENIEEVNIIEKKIRESKLKQLPEQIVIDKNAKILEIMLAMIIKDFDWLGKNTELICTSRYDDIFRGIDSVAQFMDKNETWNVGMEIDFTSSEEEMKDKIKEIGTSIKGGYTSSVKYFDSPSTGKIKNMKMPKIAFGTSMRDMGDFISIVADAYLGKNPESARKELRNHKMKDRFIDLSASQLTIFGTVAAEAGNMQNALMHHNLLDRFKKRGLIK